MVLFLFFLTKEAPASVRTAHSVVLRLFFLIRKAQRVQAFLLKLAPLSKLVFHLASTIKTATSLPFSFSQTLSLSVLPFSLLCPSFYLTLLGISGRNYLLFPSLRFGYNGSPDPYCRKINYYFTFTSLKRKEIKVVYNV